MSLRRILSGINFNALIFQNSEKIVCTSFVRGLSDKASTNVGTSTASKPPVQPSSYNSKATPAVSDQPVGPGALKSGDYKNPEYFCYNEMSYFDLEHEMMKDRIPQPKSGNEHF